MAGAGGARTVRQWLLMEWAEPRHGTSAALTAEYARITCFNGGSVHCSREEMADFVRALTWVIPLVVRGAETFAAGERVPNGEFARLVFDVDWKVGDAGCPSGGSEMEELRELAKALAHVIAGLASGGWTWRAYSPATNKVAACDGPSADQLLAVVLTRCCGVGDTDPKRGAHIVFPRIAVLSDHYPAIVAATRDMSTPLAAYIDARIYNSKGLNMRAPFAQKRGDDASRYEWGEGGVVVADGGRTPDAGWWDPANVPNLTRQVAALTLTLTPLSPDVAVAVPPPGLVPPRPHEGHHEPTTRLPASGAPDMRPFLESIARALAGRGALDASTFCVVRLDRGCIIQTASTACPNLLPGRVHGSRAFGLRAMFERDDVAFEFSCLSESLEHDHRVYLPSEIRGRGCANRVACRKLTLREYAVFGAPGTRLGDLKVCDDGLMRFVDAGMGAGFAAAAAVLGVNTSNAAPPVVSRAVEVVAAAGAGAGAGARAEPAVAAVDADYDEDGDLAMYIRGAVPRVSPSPQDAASDAPPSQPPSHLPPPPPPPPPPTVDGADEAVASAVVAEAAVAAAVATADMSRYRPFSKDQSGVLTGDTHGFVWLAFRVYGDEALHSTIADPLERMRLKKSWVATGRNIAALAADSPARRAITSGITAVLARTWGVSPLAVVEGMKSGFAAFVGRDAAGRG